MSDTLTKADIVEHLVAKTGLKKTEAKEIVESFFSLLSENLSKGQDIKLSGFGNFNIKDKKERPGRNPKTKEEKVVSARRVVTFKAGSKLDGRVVASAV